MVEVHEAVSVRYGQGLVAVVTNDLLAEAALLDGVTGAAAEHRHGQEEDNPSGHSLSVLQQLAKIDDRRVRAGNVIGHDERMVGKDTELAAVEHHRCVQCLLG